MAVLLDYNDSAGHMASRNFLSDEVADALPFRG